MFTAREIADFAVYLRQCTEAQVLYIRDRESGVPEERALAAIEAERRLDIKLAEDEHKIR